MIICRLGVASQFTDDGRYWQEKALGASANMHGSYGHFDEYRTGAADPSAQYPPSVVRYDARAYELETYPKRLSLKYVLEGEMRYEAHGRNLTLRPNEVALIASDAMIFGAASSRSSTRGVSIFFPDDVYGSLPAHVEAFSKNLLVKTPSLQPALGAKLTAVSNWQAVQPAQANAFLQSLSGDVSSYLSALCAVSERSAAKKRHTKTNHGSRMLAARAFIERGDADFFSIGELAAHFGFARFQFTRLFKRAFGVAPSRYMEERRLHKAATMIDKGDDPLHKIAEALGYPDYPTFSKAFRRARGISPRRFKHRH